MSQPATLPFFPLGLVAFPGEQVKLHIFEQRYRQLFAELRAEPEGTFVIVPFIDTQLRRLGTELTLERVVKTYASGELDVETRGVGVVEVQSFDNEPEDKLYPRGGVERLDYEFEARNTDRAELLREGCNELYKLLGVHRELPPATEGGFSFAVGHGVGLSPKQEYRLLSLSDEDARLGFLLAQLEPALEKAREASAMKHRIQMNGHFRYIRSAE